jgi:SHS2 domain-containing protein
MYELFEHTADLGLRIVATDINALFAEAAEALFAAIVEEPRSIRPTVEVKIAIDGADREFLLFDWLRELLRYQDQERFLFGRFAVSVTDSGLTASA